MRAWYALALSLFAFSFPLAAQELSDKSIAVIADYAWQLFPKRCTFKDGTSIVIDRSQQPQYQTLEEATRLAVAAGRMISHLEVCGFDKKSFRDYWCAHWAKTPNELEGASYRQKIWLHQVQFTTRLFLTGRLKLVEKAGKKEVLLDAKAKPNSTCSAENKQKVQELFDAMPPFTAAACDQITPDCKW